MPFIVVIVILGLIVVLLLLSEKKKVRKEQKTAPIKNCPLCGAELKTGERVRSESVTLPDESKILYIRGCQHCYKGSAGFNRICPVCKKQMEQDDYLLAKMWQEKNKTRVHVSGCNSCAL